MTNPLHFLTGKNIHIVGVTGSEGSSILQFLLHNGIHDITTHDFLNGNSIEKSWRLYHKGMNPEEKNEKFKQFSKNLSHISIFTDTQYLKKISEADIIFIPQSWRLYPQNKPLWELKKNRVPMYSLTRMYLDFAQAKIIAVTGTVGKGSVAHLISEILKRSGLVVYLGGNDTWMMQHADKITTMKSSDILILEVSHRQLMDGFTKSPDYVVVTNVYPNHLDEVSWEEYKKLKFLLPLSQTSSQTTILNYDNDELKNLGAKLHSHVTYFSQKYPDKNTKNVQKLLENLSNTKIDQYMPNILAAGTLVEKFGIVQDRVIGISSQTTKPPARLEHIQTIDGIDIYDDMKSTTPWATLCAIESLSMKYHHVILICGGETKNIPYESLAKTLAEKDVTVVTVKSALGDELKKYIPILKFFEMNNAQEAITVASKQAHLGDCIVVSPAGAFFYTKFIAGKKSVRKIVTSLLPKGKVLSD